MMRNLLNRGALLAGAGLLALGLASCDRRPTDAAPGSPLRITLRGAVLGGPSDALARVESARVRVAFAGSQLMDTTMAYTAAGIDLSLRLPSATGTVTVTMDLFYHGQVLFRGSGSAEVQRGTETRIPLTITPVPAGVAAPDSVLLTAIGDTVRLRGAVVLASADTIPEATVGWTGDGGSAFRITADGLVTAVQEGQGQAQASYQSFSRAVRVRVAAVVTRVSVTPDTLSLYVDSARTLAATARDRNGNLLQRTISWRSSNAAVASVDANGAVRGVGPGTATITASVGSVSASATVVVRQNPVASVKVTPASATVVVSDTVRLTATTYGANGDLLTGRPIAWSSSNPQVATVDTAGLVRGVSVGSVTIRATSEGQSATAAIQVVQPIVAGSSPQVIFSAAVGGSGPTPQTVSITNAGTGTLSGLTASVSYPAGAASGWLGAALSSTTAPATLTLTPAMTGLPVGVYDATVTVRSTVPGAGTVLISVQLVVRAATPIIGLSATNVSLRMRTDTLGARVTYNVSVSNLGGGTLSGLSADLVDNQYCSVQLSGSTAPATLTIFCAGSPPSTTPFTGTITVSSSIPGVAARTVNLTYAF